MALVVASACAQPTEPAPAHSPVSTPWLVTEAPPLECSFDPVSRAGGARRSGFELCFTPRVGLGLPAPQGAASAPVPSASPAEAPAPPSPPPPCPPEMVLVEGDYCPKPVHRCLKYLDEQGAGTYLSKHRCAVYDRTVECKAPLEHRRYCIDRDEYTAPGDTLPLVDQSWTMSRDLCESMGKRLCFESEWEFACSGEERRPYPYGFERDARRCNHDLMNLTKRGKLIDHRVPSSARPDCISPFGVRNLVGNVDEWAWRDGVSAPHRASMRGGWWLAGRNNCVAATTAHDEYYNGPQSGFRCCANAL